MRVVLNYSFLIVMIVVGFALAFSNMDSFTGSLPIPMGCIYLAAPISALLMMPLYLEYVLIERGKN
jgi:TRAP-type C4-dicarboxylate transport system permease small subunit